MDKVNLIKDLVQRIGENYPEEQRDKILAAYEFAKEAHTGQKRQSGEDYFTHPCNVAAILVDFGLDYETIMAALLHDVIEDTNATGADIEKLFGKTVLGLVNGVTKLDRLQFQSKVDEQAENLRKMLFAMSDDIRVIIIKLADRLHNMRTLSFKTPEKQVMVAKETLEIYAPIAARLGMGTIKGELEDLSMRYLAPDEYYALVENVAAKRVERQEFVEKVVAEIEEKLKEMNIEGEVNGRPKHFYSIYKKMKAGKTFEQIYDLIAVRIIVDTVKDCYAVLGAIHTMWRPLPGRFKDYIAMPKPNNYQSLHTTVITSYGSPFEIQIRTREMHAVAEYGIAAHWKYKEGITAAEQGSKMEDKIRWLRSVMEVESDLKDNAEFLASLKLDLYPDEVFVITPKGDVINLPAGATGIDYAYAIHSAVGNKCVGIKVDGKIVPLNTKLTNNTIVEVITSNTSKGPSRDWLKFVVTPGARNKIRQFFKKEMREENIKRGKEMLEREARHRGYNLSELVSNENWRSFMMQRYTLHTLEDIYAEVGYGTFTTNKVLLRLIDYFKKDMMDKKPVLEVKPIENGKKKDSNGILLAGYDDFLIRLSHCCNPVPGDKIIGYVSRGRGVSIHRADCPNMRNVEEERIIEAQWPDRINQKFNATLDIVAYNRGSLLLDLTALINNQKLQITKVNARVDENQQALINVGVEIENIETLDMLIKKIKGVEGVVDVYRSHI